MTTMGDETKTSVDSGKTHPTVQKDRSTMVLTKPYAEGALVVTVKLTRGLLSFTGVLLILVGSVNFHQDSMMLDTLLRVPVGLRGSCPGGMVLAIRSCHSGYSVYRQTHVSGNRQGACSAHASCWYCD